MKSTGKEPFSFGSIMISFFTGILAIATVVMLAWTAWTKYDLFGQILSLPFMGILGFLGYGMFYLAWEKWDDNKEYKRRLQQEAQGINESINSKSN